MSHRIQHGIPHAKHHPVACSPPDTSLSGLNSCLSFVGVSTNSTCKIRGRFNHGVGRDFHRCVDRQKFPDGIESVGKVVRVGVITTHLGKLRLTGTRRVEIDILKACHPQLEGREGRRDERELNREETLHLIFSFRKRLINNAWVGQLWFGEWIWSFHWDYIFFWIQIFPNFLSFLNFNFNFIIIFIIIETYTDHQITSKGRKVHPWVCRPKGGVAGTIWCHFLIYHFQKVNTGRWSI